MASSGGASNEKNLLVQASGCPGAAAPACASAGRNLSWALQVAVRSLDAQADPAVDQVPGGGRGFLVLATVARGPGRSQLAMARRLGIDKTVMTYLLDDLETAGLVERRPDPADRRARQVLITTAGSDQLTTTIATLDAAERSLLAPLDATEQDAFREMLERIAAATQTQPNECPSLKQPDRAEPLGGDQ